MSGRLFKSSRGQILRLLRRAQQTVNDLARTLGLTDNAVRAHLARLERDGLIQQVGRRPGFRKPESTYDITPEAERLLFSKAYAPVLAAVLGVMEAGRGHEDLEAQLRAAGRRLAAPHLPALVGLPFRQRAQRALQILEDLGGMAELEEKDRRLYVRGFACPLSQIVADHPKVCRVAQVLVSELLGREVHEQCDRGERPKCCFMIS
jgi:predicted ArsR family transcriptional regulator